MEATPETPQEPAGPPAAAGELIVQNGRHGGTRTPLAVPLTLIGRSAACDVRLNVDGIEPLHCALVHGPAGLLLRDLAGGDVRVNGGLPGGALRDGDTLSVGPFQFLLRLSAEVGAAAAGQFLLHELEAVERERGALRIQAAAVAAQQAELTEAEARLEQRRGALERQEEQLGKHLEAKRGKLLELQGEVRAARQGLHDERKAYAEQSGRDFAAVEQGRQEIAAANKALQAERRGVADLRERLKKRWHEQLAAEKAALRQREEDVAGRERGLEQEAERLERERAALVQQRLRFNGDVELGRRQVQAGRDDLRQQQRQGQERQAREQAALLARARALNAREAALAEAERDLAEQTRHLEELRPNLQREAEGLESRIRNQRRKLADLEQQLARLGTPPSPESGPAEQAVPVAVAPESPDLQAMEISADADVLRQQQAVVERLAAELADERLHLAEQCERLVGVQRCWQDEHAAITAELEAAGLRLSEREQEIAARERALEASEYDLRQRHQEAAHGRQHLEGWLARLAVREAAWEGERDRLRIQGQAREESAQRQLAVLLDLRRSWAGRRRKEAKQLRAGQERYQRLRQQYLTLWTECSRRSTALEQERRAVAERSLTLEHFRLELLGQAIDSAATERRLERLRRRWSSLSAAAERNLAQGRLALEAEAARMQEFGRLLEQDAVAVAEREQELATRQTDWEQQQALRETADAKLRQELQSLQAHRELYERQLGQLRDEVERMARLLLDGTEPPLLAVAQAA